MVYSATLLLQTHTDDSHSLRRRLFATEAAAAAGAEEEEEVTCRVLHSSIFKVCKFKI